MHSWNDEEDFAYWKEVSEAARYIGLFCRNFGCISVRDYKEKYGTVRVYCSFGWATLHDIFYPGYVYIQRPRWLMQIRVPFWINKILVPYQIFIYRLAYKNAIKKWPMIREEILCFPDWDEYLGGL